MCVSVSECVSVCVSERVCVRVWEGVVSDAGALTVLAMAVLMNHFQRWMFFSLCTPRSSTTSSPPTSAPEQPSDGTMLRSLKYALPGGHAGADILAPKPFGEQQ